MPSAELVSIILATCNGANFISEQLDSLLRQTHQNLEIIVSDDRSDDGTVAIIETFSKKDKRIRLIVNDFRWGVATNFLNSLKLANGEFICFCDQDDYWRVDKIERLVALMKTHPNNALAYSDLEICDESLHVINPSFFDASGFSPLQGKLDERVLIRNVAPGCSMLFSKWVKDKLVKWALPNPFMHDHLAFAVSSSMGNIVYTLEKLIKYRQHSQNIIGARQQKSFQVTDFYSQLGSRISFFEAQFGAPASFNLNRLKAFAFSDSNPSKILGTISHLKYFLTMSPKTLKYRLVASLKCIFPCIYRIIKNVADEGI